MKHLHVKHCCCRILQKMDLWILLVAAVEQLLPTSSMFAMMIENSYFLCFKLLVITGNPLTPGQELFILKIFSLDICQIIATVQHPFFFSPVSFVLVSLFSFCYTFTAVIDLLLDLLPVQKFLRNHRQDGHFLLWSSQV